MKRLLLTLFLTIFVTGCVAEGENSSTTSETAMEQAKQEDNIKLVMVMAITEIQSDSFCQTVWDGFKRAQKEYGFSAEKLFLGELTEDSYEASKLSIMPYIEDDILICAVGGDLADIIKDLALSNESADFVLIDHEYDEEIPNIKTVSFKDNEVSYLAGIIAGRMSETNKIGFVGGVRSPLIERFQYGFMAGVKEGSWSGDVSVSYANTFLDADLGERAANNLYKKGCDVIYHAAGYTGIGVINSAIKNDKMVIGCDRDQYYLAPKNVIASTIKNVDKAIISICGTYLNEGYSEIPPHTEYSFLNGGLDISKGAERRLPNDLLEFLDIQKERIKNGQIDIPYDRESYIEFARKYE